MRAFMAVCLGLGLGPVWLHAELERHPTLSSGVITQYAAPKVAVPAGWHLDPERSNDFQASALAPDGSTFTDAVTVMYAKAISRRSRPELKSLNDLIAHDRRSFETGHPGIFVREVGALPTADGRRLRTFTFFPDGNEGNWEQVSYDEEDSFFLIFALSSRTLDGYLGARAAFDWLVASYRHGH